MEFSLEKKRAITSSEDRIERCIYIKAQMYSHFWASIVNFRLEAEDASNRAQLQNAIHSAEPNIQWDQGLEEGKEEDIEKPPMRLRAGMYCTCMSPVGLSPTR